MMRKVFLQDSGYFINKIWKMGFISDNTILVTTDVTTFYPSIPHVVGLKTLREVLEKRKQKTIPTEELVKMTEFVLKNNAFEFNDQIEFNGLEEPNVHQYMLAYLGIKWRENLWRIKNINPLPGLDLSMIFSLFALVAKRNLRHSWKILTGYIPI